MDDKKKKFVVPDAEVVDFATEDIVTISTFATNGFLYDGDRENWDED